jgi:3-deoxy-D-manno-octulosonate 8-phosphate phosphatase KdsC-like HAD superfamily phosphatase
MEALLLLDGAFAAALQFQDAPRAESKSFIGHLHPRHGARKVLLLSGDREAEVRYLASEVGISEVLSNKSPEEKVAIVRQETALAPTLFVGDGINDAPAMQAATVGIAFGQNSDVTAEAAGACHPRSLAAQGGRTHPHRPAPPAHRPPMRHRRHGAEPHRHGRRRPPATCRPLPAPVAQEFIDLAAVLNALRMALPTGELSDIEA